MALCGTVIAEIIFAYMETVNESDSNILAILYRINSPPFNILEESNFNFSISGYVI